MSTNKVSAGGILQDALGVLREHELTYLKAGAPWMSLALAALIGAEYALDQGPLGLMALGVTLCAFGMLMMSAMPWIIAGTSAAEVEGKPRSIRGARASIKVALQVGTLNLLCWFMGGLPALAVHAYVGAAAPAAGLGAGDALGARRAARRAQRGHFTSVFGALVAAHALFAVFGISVLVVLIPGLDAGLPEWTFTVCMAALYLMYSVVMASMQHGILRALERARTA